MYKIRVDCSENDEGEWMGWLVADDRQHALIAHGASLAVVLRNLADQLEASEVPAVEIDWDGGPEIDGQPVTNVQQLGHRRYVFTAHSVYLARPKPIHNGPST